jgi:hypothetical protein
MNKNLKKYQVVDQAKQRLLAKLIAEEKAKKNQESNQNDKIKKKGTNIDSQQTEETKEAKPRKLTSQESQNLGKKLMKKKTLRQEKEEILKKKAEEKEKEEKIIEEGRKDFQNKLFKRGKYNKDKVLSKSQGLKEPIFNRLFNLSKKVLEKTEDSESKEEKASEEKAVVKKKFKDSVFSKLYNKRKLATNEKGEPILLNNKKEKEKNKNKLADSNVDPKLKTYTALDSVKKQVKKQQDMGKENANPSNLYLFLFFKFCLCF